MHYDIVIAGAGPVGLSLALRMAREGKRVLVLEKNPTTHEHSRAPAIWPRTQEVLADLDVLDRFLEQGIIHDTLSLHYKEASKPLISFPLYELKDVTKYPQFLILPQSKTEKILYEKAVKARAEVEFSAELTGFYEEGNSVFVTYRKNGKENTVEASYLIGCDGAHSKVRELLGFHLKGETYGMKAALADVRLKTDAPSPLLSRKGVLVVAIKIDTDLWRLILPFPKRSKFAPEERVPKAVEQLFPGVPYEDVWQSEFRLHNRIATGFAKGRVALAGDAAHLNSPVGGQGMNSGIQDTEILASLLLKALKEDDPSQLEIYERRRQAAVRSGVNAFTDLLTQFLFFNQGAFLPFIVRAWSLIIKIPFIRRKFLKNMAMVE